MQTDELHKFIKEFMPSLDADKRSVALGIYRSLADSESVSTAALGGRTGLEPSKVEAIVSSWSGVFRDDRGDVVGFWGLTAQPVSKHVLRIKGRVRYAWCAWDCLFIPALLDQTAQVTSVCPQSGEPIGLIVSPSSVEQVRPASTVLSMLIPDLGSCAQDIVSNFCHFIYFFKNSEAAMKWTAAHPGTQVITIDRGMELGRMKNEWQYGETRRPAGGSQATGAARADALEEIEESRGSLDPQVSDCSPHAVRGNVSEEEAAVPRIRRVGAPPQ